MERLESVAANQHDKSAKSALQAEYSSTLSGAQSPAVYDRYMAAKAQSDGIQHTYNQGQSYSNFLQNLIIAHGSDGELTKDMIRSDEASSQFSTEEYKMLEFTDKHFKELTDLQDQSASKKTLSLDDANELKNYPVIPKMSDAYQESIAEKGAWAGAAVGAAVEVGSYIAAPAVGLHISATGGAVMGGLMAYSHLNLIDGAETGLLTATAWGPIVVGAIGYYSGKRLAAPLWNQTKAPEFKNLYNDISRDIPLKY